MRTILFLAAFFSLENVFSNPCLNTLLLDGHLAQYYEEISVEKLNADHPSLKREIALIERDAMKVYEIKDLNSFYAALKKNVNYSPSGAFVSFSDRYNIIIHDVADGIAEPFYMLSLDPVGELLGGVAAISLSILKVPVYACAIPVCIGIDFINRMINSRKKLWKELKPLKDWIEKQDFKNHDFKIFDASPNMVLIVVDGKTFIAF